MTRLEDLLFLGELPEKGVGAIYEDLLKKLQQERPAYQERVDAELGALMDKLEKLQAFLETASFGALPEAEQRRLERQLALMGLYADVLVERIEAFR